MRIRDIITSPKMAIEVALVTRGLVDGGKCDGLKYSFNMPNPLKEGGDIFLDMALCAVVGAWFLEEGGEDRWAYNIVSSNELFKGFGPNQFLSPEAVASIFGVDDVEELIEFTQALRRFWLRLQPRPILEFFYDGALTKTELVPIQRYATDKLFERDAVSEADAGGFSALLDDLLKICGQWDKDIGKVLEKKRKEVNAKAAKAAEERKSKEAAEKAKKAAAEKALKEKEKGDDKQDQSNKGSGDKGTG